MIKQDIVQRVADRLGITKVKAAEVVVGFFDVMKEALKDGERIELRGFGVLMVKNRKTGIGRNPKTGEVKRWARPCASSPARTWNPSSSTDGR